MPEPIVSSNHAGVCLSYDMTWEYVQHLTQKANFQTVVKEGPWLWVYDNSTSTPELGMNTKVSW